MGATLLSALIDRFPLLVYAGAGLLAYIALEMILEDGAIRELLSGAPGGFELVFKLAGTAVFVVILWLWSRRREPGGAGSS